MQRNGFYPYGPSKTALEASTRIWAEDLDSTGITSNVLIPGRAADTAIMPTEWRESGTHHSGQEPATCCNGATDSMAGVQRFRWYHRPTI